MGKVWVDVTLQGVPLLRPNWVAASMTAAEVVVVTALGVMALSSCEGSGLLLPIVVRTAGRCRLCRDDDDDDGCWWEMNADARKIE